MRLIKNIHKIISDIICEKEQERMKKNFFDFLNKWEVEKFNISKEEIWETKEQKENRKKYKKYDSKSKKNKELKETFLKRVCEDSNSFCCYCWKDKLTHFWWDWWTFKRLYDIEHFLPRSKFPDLSINLYNWLPVCMSCNQRLKKDKNPLNSWEIFHPYFWFIPAIQDKPFTFWDTETLDTKYSFKENERKELIYNSDHSKFFRLPEIYLNSQDTFNTFNFIQDKRTKMKDEKIRFKENSKTDTELKDYFFKNYYPKSENEILKYSNWKLKKDLIENLEL